VEGLIHDKRGVLSMANSGADKNTSQFFITYGKHTSLDKRFTVFG
jgi:peptidyl-prolyl cis-trans isomerase-like 3